MGIWANGTQTAPDAQQVHRIHSSKQAIEFPGDLDTWSAGSKLSGR